MKESESSIQKEIMEHLRAIPQGKVIRLDGQGIIIGGRRVKQNKTHLDILFLYQGQAFFMEVKTPSEKEFILKHKERLLEGNFNSDNKNLKRYKSQIEEVNEIRATGNQADFVASIDDVNKMIQ